MVAAGICQVRRGDVGLFEASRSMVKKTSFTLRGCFVLVLVVRAFLVVGAFGFLFSLLPKPLSEEDNKAACSLPTRASFDLFSLVVWLELDLVMVEL